MHVERLHALFMADRGSPAPAPAAAAADAPSAAQAAGPGPTLQQFGSAIGGVLHALYGGSLARRFNRLNVTCGALPAAPENWPPKMANKKERKLAKFGPKDPNRSGNVQVCLSTLASHGVPASRSPHLASPLSPSPPLRRTRARLACAT